METLTVGSELPQNLQNYLNKIIEKKGYVTYKVDTQSAEALGTGFLSSSYTVAVKGEIKDGEKETQIFVKGIISSDAIDETMDLPGAFRAEAFVYNELSRVFIELQDEAGIPAEDRFRIIKSYGESGCEGIFLQNVAIKGYKTYDRTHEMTVDLAEMALKELAKFHALSFVIKSKRPDFFEQKIKTMKHPFRFNDTIWREGATNIAKLCARRVKGVAKEKLDKFITNYAEKWANYQLDQTSVGTCLCHGDFRIGNLLVRHNGDKLEDLYIVDYQLMSFGCPVNDILFFIFLGADQKFRRQHLDRLVEFYYTSFRSFLKKFDLDSEDVYPKKEFLKDYKKNLPYGLVVALYFMTFFLAKAEALPNLSKQDLRYMDFEVMDELPEKIQKNVEDFVEWGYL